MKIQVPSYIKNAPAGSNVPNPSVHATPSNINPNPKRSKIRMLLFVLAVVILGAAAGYYFFFVMNGDSDDNTNLVATTTNVNQNVNKVALNSNVANINSNLNTINNGSSLNINISSNLNKEDMINTDFDEEYIRTMIIDGRTVNMDADDDGDTLNNIFESVYGTSINTKDTDSDGYDDQVEISTCYNPISTGVMDGSYYSEVYCPNGVRVYLDTIKKSNIITEEQQNIIQNTYSGLCNDWSLFAEEAIENALSMEQSGDLYNMSNQMFKLSCDKTIRKYNSGEFNELIKYFEYISVNAEEFCLEVSSHIKSICGPMAIL